MILSYSAYSEPKIKHEHLCHFRNVCYSPKTARFNYYRDEKSAKEIIRTVNADFRFEYEFIENYMSFSLKSVHPEFDIVNGSMPEDITENVRHFTDDVVWHYSLMHFAYSHLLMDHFYAMWRTLNYFHLYDSNASRALFVGYKSKDKVVDYRYIYDNLGAKRVDAGSWDHHLLSNEIGLKFVDEIWPFLWNQRPLFLSFKDDFIDDDVFGNDLIGSVFEDISGSELICFDSVVIEMGYWFRHWDLSRFIQLFIDKVHETDDQEIREMEEKKESTEPLHQQKILILAQNGTDGRRQIASDPSLESIGDYLSDLFGVEVVVAFSNELYDEMTLKEQIKWMEQFTVLIHSGGDESYLLWFMKERTATITMDWYQREQNGNGHSVHFDADHVEFDPLRKTFYYFMTDDDVVEVEVESMVQREGEQRIKKWDIKNLHRYKLDAQRLANYVHSALLWVEHWNEWHDTFTIPSSIPSFTV